MSEKASWMEESLSPESFYSLRLKEWSQQIPLIRLSSEWEKNILDLIPNYLKRRHPRCVEKTLLEIREIYENDMRNCALRSIISSCEPGVDDQQIKEFVSRAKKKKENLCNVPRQRVLFGKKYFLSHTIMKNIIEAASKLPRVIVDLTKYRNVSFFEFSELQQALISNIDGVAVTIRNDYYVEIVKSISSYVKKYGKNSKSKKFMKLINCATNLFAQQIIRLMMSTIDELTKSLADYRHRCPQLNIRVVWNEGRLSTDPTIDQIYSLWHNIVNAIERIAENLLIFEQARIRSGKVDTEVIGSRIKVVMPDWYMEKSHNRVDEALGDAIGPLEKYFETIVKDFGKVSSPEMKLNILKLVSKGRNFEVYCSNVKDLTYHYEKANELIDNLYYDIGRLDQSAAKVFLRAHIADMRGILIDKLLFHHREYNNEICQEFRELEHEMLDIPRNAKALFELSEKISYASRVLVETLEKRVRKSIVMLSSLLELTIDMSESHMELNSKTINWLGQIKPIFVKSNSLCESMKSELEDELQRRINNLNIEIEGIIPQFVILDDMDDATRVEEYVEHLAVLVGHVDELDNQIKQINFEEKLFKFPETSFPSVEEIRDILMPVYSLNNLMCQWRRDRAVWLHGPFEYIDAQEVTTKTLDYHKRFDQLNTSLRTKIKVDIQSSANKPFKYSGVVDDPDPMQQPAPLKLCCQVLEDVESFEQHLELIECVCNPALRERHWEEMALIRELGGGDRDSLRFTPNAGTTLHKLIALDLQKDIDKYRVVSIGANKELALARTLQDMVTQWDTMDFTIVASEPTISTQTSPRGALARCKMPSTFAHLHEIQILMEEHSIVIREMKASYFVKPISSALMELSLTLERVEDTIQRFLYVQNEWFDLEAVFKDARHSERAWQHEKLTEASEIFFNLNEALQEVKKEIMDEPKFRSISEKSFKFIKLLRDANDKLEIVKGAVKNYIKEMRNLFPRFYFLDDHEVVKIVFEPIISTKMKLLLKKCFSDIRSLRITNTSGDCAIVVSIIDSHNQELSLKRIMLWEPSVKIHDKSISSFIAIEKALISAVRESIVQCSSCLIENCESISQQQQLLLNEDTIGMASLCSWRIYWTCKVEEAFLSLETSALLTSFRNEQSFMLKALIANLRGQLSRKQRKKLVSLIIQIRDQHDITRVVLTTARGPQDFNWKAQVRHYWQANDVKVAILDTESLYGYEYSACEKPLITTPLTDRCYRSVMEAYRNGLCGVLFGPIAAAKTHCVKELARTLAVRLYVYNCHEYVLNYSYIDNVFRGLIGCSPCWLFFKNLNLLTIQMQSVLAQQISIVSQYTITGSSGRRVGDCQGITRKLRDPGYCFITGTISTKYPIETHPKCLSDDLKILFRPIAMTLPDTKRIVEVELFAEGFVDAAIFAEKIRLVEKYSMDQLSSEASPYDFSIRSTKSVIKTACALKNCYPNMAENALILRALVDVHLPKFTRTSDILVFQHIIEDVFPRVDLPSPNYAMLLSGVNEIRRIESPTEVSNDRLYNLKIIQLFEMLFVRHAIVVVGPPLSGKTSIIDTLGETLSLLNKKSIDKSPSNPEDVDRLPTVESVRINHIALALEEIFGCYEDSSGKVKLSWKDGILTRTLRSFSEEECKRHFSMQWLILDGPLDESIFLDKLSTLLDENKTLFLTSGERISINDSTSIIIETISLKKSSPATTSRCGIIYVEEATIGWKGLARCWIAEQRTLLPARSDDNRDYRSDYAIFLQSVLEWSLGVSLDFVCNRLSPSVRPLTNKNHLVASMLKILEMYLRDALGENAGCSTVADGENSSTEPPKWTIINLFVWTQAALLMAIIWGLGGALDRDSRVALDEFCTSTWRTGGNNPDFPRPEVLKSFELSLPIQGLIQDHIYVFNGTGNWRHWSDVLKKNSMSNGNENLSKNWKTSKTNYVPTIDSEKYIHLFEMHVKHRKPFLLLGEMATGKTLYMQYLLKSKICQSNYFSNFLSLGFAGPSCNSSWAQKMFLSKMAKLKRGVYGPGKGRLCVNFIDDLNVALNSNNSRDEAALELIRQYHDTAQWYETKSGNKILLCDIMFLGAITMDCSNEWNDKWREPRFFRHFNLYSVDHPTDESIFKIYSNILFTNLRTNQFNADVSGSVNSIIKATIEMYSLLQQTLRPVPSKFQYRFTLRDINRVIIGCSFIHKESVETKVTFIRLWVHEILRVFADRIIDTEDSEFLFLKIKQSVGAHFKDTFETAFDNLPKNDNDQLTTESFRQFIFSDFMQLDLDVETIQMQQNRKGNNNTGSNENNNKKRYEEITCSREALRNKAILYLNRCNDLETEARKKLDILILPSMLEHLIRICRILSIPGGNLLMICFGGSSRRSLTALASYLKGHSFHELSHPVSSSIGEPWRRDLKRACMSCTAGAKSSVASDSTFFLTDRQISEAPSSLLRDICSLMKTGQIPDLFTTEERESIVERSRLLAQNGDRNMELKSLDVIDYFYNSCQEKLHFILYFDRGYERTKNRGCFRGSFRYSIFNSIVSHCSIDCYESWPEESFYEIANTFMKEINVEKDVKSKAIEASRYFYDSVGIWRGRRSGDKVFPVNKRGSNLPVATYLHMVKLYSLLMTKRQNEIRASRKRYIGGLEKLQLAGEEVREMKNILTRLRPELEQSAKETAETMKKIERENVSVENATIQVKREEQVANKIAKVAGILKEECEADLAVAIPILEDAIAALNTLKPTDITLVKAMKNPPDTVKLVLAAVCVMLNVAPDRSVDPVTGKKSIDYWAPSKRILGDMNFLQNLKDYDKDNIAPSVMLIINKTYINDENFMPQIVAKASSAAEGLCKWVRAMVSYDEVAKVVAPKKEKLAGAERECNASLEYLNEKRKSLAALNDKLAALNVVLEATLARKVQLEKQVANCTDKLAKAEGLITSLAGEKARWLRSAETLRQSYDCLAGDLLLSCGLVAFLGIFDATHREIHIKEWRSQLRRLCIPSSEKVYDFVSSLESEIEVNNWKQAGLSNNYFSQGNAAIMKNSLLWPIFLDPENQANLWIRRMEAINKIRVVKATDPEWLEEIEKCVEDDVPVVVENLERSKYFESTILDYILCHICPRFNYYALEAASPSLQQSKYLRYFRFYVTIRVSLHEAALEPHIYKKMNVINFSLADEALEDRLLEIVVSRERPELQDTFDKLMASSANNKKVLKEEEDKILAILSGSSSVNIIEDERAIETLDYSKNLSLEIMRREEAARATNRQMDEFRATYRPLTKYCSALYDTVASIANLNHMYRFSLDWFTRLYVNSIDKSMKSVVLDKRLKYLKTSFTKILHSSVRNALLEEHKLVYSFLLTIKILLDSKRITQEEIRLFKDSASFQLQQKTMKNVSINYRINDLEKLSKALPHVFQDLPTSFLKDKSIWKDYCDKNEDPSSLPPPWEKLSEFQQLILANIIKPGKILPMIISLVENTLEMSLNSLATYSIARCFEESSCLIPLIFILPSYLGISGIVRKWAKTMGYSSNVSIFSMGTINEFTGARINDSIERARQQGGWILLENCHLATDYWFAKLEKICESLDPSNTVLSFRLWLTSYPTQSFPISILQNSIKIHWEGPCDRIKESLLCSYQSEPLNDPDFYNSCPGKNKAFSKLVYALCFFHAVVRGRYKFGKRAWNVLYEFTDLDLKIAIGQLQNFLNKSCEQVPTNFEALIYLIGECYYGGRILDPIDRCRVKTILQDYCNPRIIQATSNYVLAANSVDDCLVQYFVPNRTEYHDYIKHINNFIPDGETRPEIFGLDDNASVIRDTRNTAEFTHALCVLFADNLLANNCNYYAGAATEDCTTSSSCTNIDCYFKIEEQGGIESTLRNIIEGIKDKLLQQGNYQDILLDITSVRSKYLVSYTEPLNALLIEETESYNNLIEMIRDSLVDVERTYEKGLAPLFYTSMTIDELARDFIENRIPLTWMSISSESGSWREQSLPQFIDYLTKRRIFLNNWITMGHRGSFWLGGMVCCRKFISASRLMMARQCEIGLSDLNFEYKVLKMVIEDSKPWEFVGVDDLSETDASAASSTSIKCGKGSRVKGAAIHIHGLFLSGARWDIERSTLVESLPKLYWHSMPVIRFGPRYDFNTIERRNGDEWKQQRCVHYYSCPVNASNISTTEKVNFLNSLSNDYIMTIPLESRDISPDYWIKRATTLYCNKGD